MNIIINGILFSPERDKIVLVFKDDNNRRVVANQIAGMAEKEGVRMYAMYPNGLNGNEIIDECLKIINTENN